MDEAEAEVILSVEKCIRLTNRLVEAEAEVERLRSATCETCRHWRDFDPADPFGIRHWCEKQTGVHVTPGKFGCNRWAGREPDAVATGLERTLGSGDPQ